MQMLSKSCTECEQNNSARGIGKIYARGPARERSVCGNGAGPDARDPMRAGTRGMESICKIHAREPSDAREPNPLCPWDGPGEGYSR
jgi:hypothetical protein